MNRIHSWKKVTRLPVEQPRLVGVPTFHSELPAQEKLPPQSVSGMILREKFLLLLVLCNLLLPPSSWVLNSATEKVTCTLRHKGVGVGGWAEAAGSAESERLETHTHTYMCVHTYTLHPPPQHWGISGAQGRAFSYHPSPPPPPRLVRAVPEPPHSKTQTCCQPSRTHTHVGTNARFVTHKLPRFTQRTLILTHECAKALSLLLSVSTLSKLCLHTKQLRGERLKGGRKRKWICFLKKARFFWQNSGTGPGRRAAGPPGSDTGKCEL